MKKIAIVTSERWYRKSREDLHLERALLATGMEPEIVCWTDKRCWHDYDLIILRSIWDYHLHHSAFCTWLYRLQSAGVNLANGATRILQNIHKDQQIALLTDCPVPVVPTQICHNTKETLTASHKLNSPQIVIKPCVSASGFNTFCVDMNRLQAEQELLTAVRHILDKGCPVIVQPFIPAIRSGEISLVYMNGIYSHSVRRFPGVLTERQRSMPVMSVSSTVMKAAGQIISYIHGEDLLYVRVDLIESGSQIFIMELEMGEPDLYLSLDYGEYNPTAAFIKAIQYAAGGNRCI